MRIPSLRNLQVFEMAARHENFRKAADALFLTHGAVGRQVKTLEAELGISLFARAGKRVALTQQGRRLQFAMTEALKLIADATVDVRQQTCTDPGDLQITLPPCVASRWLGCRIGDYMALHPGVAVELIPTVSVLELADQDIHVGIRMGKGHWEGVRSELLVREFLFPVMSASGIDGYDGMPASVEDLLRYPLLNPYDDWGRWFRKAGVPTQSMIKGRTFENISSLLNAVENGQGIALAHKWLVGDAIDDGRLVRLPGPCVPARRDYYIVYPKGTALSPATCSFIAWLHETAAADA